jgi:ribonuclease HII
LLFLNGFQVNTLSDLMQVSLNFSKKEAKELNEFFNQFQVLPNTNQFHLKRVKIGESTVTLFYTGKLTIQGKNCDKVKELILTAMQEKKELFFGLDETGRGEIDGALVVCGVLGEKNKLRELRDSKKTNNISEKFIIASNNSQAQILIALNPELIDELRKKGLTLNKIQEKIMQKQIELIQELIPETKTIIDGTEMNLNSKNIEFLIKGDDLNPVIGAASVIAKHYRNISGNKEKRKTWKNF